MDLPDETSLLAQPTRARLFAQLLELRRAATTEELADELDLHVNGVRRQLQLMEEGGLLKHSRSAHGRGRPRDEWSISATASPTGAPPEGYGDLARWLVRSMASGPKGLRQIEKTGREIGRELAPQKTDDLAASLAQIFSALGFQPAIQVEAEGHLSCTLGNCPYRDSVRESSDIICTLHKGITQGLLDGLDPTARLQRFEPRDPDRAGCQVEVVGAEKVSAAPSP